MISQLGRSPHLLAVALAVSLFAGSQEVKKSASLTIKVRDVSGAVLSNAEVHLVERSSNAEKIQITDATGITMFKMNPGDYRLTVISSGFKSMLMPDLEVQPGENRKIDATLGAQECPPGKCGDLEGGPPFELESAKLGSLEIKDAPTSTGTLFHWNWRDWQELNAEQSLRKAKLMEQRREAIANAIADEIRPMMADLEIQSETELQKAALDTRVKMIDLNGNGVSEVVAQGMVGCGATGNCPFWILRKTKHGYELILEGEAQTFTIQNSSSNGFRDIVLSRHGSASSGDLTLYQFREDVYRDVGCYYYEWNALEGGKAGELKEPRITPCR